MKWSQAAPATCQIHAFDTTASAMSLQGRADSFQSLYLCTVGVCFENITMQHCQHHSAIMMCTLSMYARAQKLQNFLWSHSWLSFLVTNSLV